MDHFQYKNGVMHCEDIALPDMAAAVGTPVYVYSAATLTRHFQVFDQAFDGLDHLVCFAVKANSNQAVLTLLGSLGAGADVVSGGELQRALRAGIAAEKIVFSGVGKTHQEMQDALKAGIKQFNVESEAELEQLNQVAASLNMIAPVSIRVNPDVDAGTHDKITTGKADNKFGIAWSKVDAVYKQIKSLGHVKAVGVDVHIGSQLTDLTPFKRAYAKVADLVRSLQAAGHDIHHIDLGGGLGIPYDPAQQTPPDPRDYAAIVKEIFGHMGCQLIFEPGRMIAGNAGILLTKNLLVKEGENRRFYILDAAMNDLARPAMYDAHHDIVPVIEAGCDLSPVDYVGPVCETGDSFAIQRPAPDLKAGDLVAIRSAGAYGAVMASTYNSRPLVSEVLVSGDKYHVIRERQTIDALIDQDSVPDWLPD